MIFDKQLVLVLMLYQKCICGTFSRAEASKDYEQVELL